MPSIRDLPWLIPPPDDFRKRCRNLPDLPADTFGEEVRLLASHALKSNQLHHLATALRHRRATAKDMAPLQPLRLAVVSNGTTDLLAAALAATGARYGFDVDIIEGLFGQATQEGLDPQSIVNSAKPDYVLLALDYRALPMETRPADETSEQAALDTAFAWLNSLRDGFRRHGSGTVIVSLFAPPVEPLFGSLDVAVPGSMRRLLERLNHRLAEDVRKAGDLILDTASLAAAVGVDEWYDDVYWATSKLPFAQAFVPLYADCVWRVVAAARGKARKCLVLDLDNTVWGGVIGDDGISGIVIGNGNPTGEAFLAVQRLALALRQRGVLLAVSSKNEEAAARAPFQSHPEMLLRESHIAVFQANWIDKASNLRSIANTLNIGLDALVLLDDNPAERALIRRELPEVAVPDLPTDPAHYPRILAWAGYFETVSYSTEDAERAQYYASNAKRAELAATTTDMDGYLASLEMVMTVLPFGPIGRSRIAQLINKTNQFNLTTRRYTEQQVAALEEDQTVVALQVRLTDTFGDNGMISVVIGIPDGDVLDIDTWLMSCRVLNRGVERALLNVLVGIARARGYKHLRGHYRPTQKNDLVREHYGRLGFTLTSEDGDGSLWHLPLGTFQDLACHVHTVIKNEE